MKKLLLNSFLILLPVGLVSKLYAGSTITAATSGGEFESSYIYYLAWAA